MISRAYIFLTIGRQLAKAATTAADHVPDGTPEERSQIAQHVAAIYRILRAATVRRGEIWRIPHAGAGTGHSQRQPGPAFGATSKRDTPVQAHLSSVPATPEWSGAGAGDVPYQGPGSDRVRDRYANTSAALVMRITASDIFHRSRGTPPHHQNNPCPTPNNAIWPTSSSPWRTFSSTSSCQRRTPWSRSSETHSKRLHRRWNGRPVCATIAPAGRFAPVSVRATPP